MLVLYARPLVICRPNVAIRKSPENSYLYSLLMQQNKFPSHICTRRILRQTRPYFYRVDGSGRWAFSVPDPVQLTVRCSKDREGYDRMSSSYDSHTKIIHGTGFLQLHPDCSAHAPNLILHSSYTGRSRYDNLTLGTSFVVPKVGDVLTPAELSEVSQALNDSVFDMLETDVNEVVHMEHLRNGMALQELQQKLRVHKRILGSKFPWYDERLFVAPLLVGCVTVFIIFLFVLWIKLKSGNLRKMVCLPLQVRKKSKISQCPNPLPEEIKTLEEE